MIVLCLTILIMVGGGWLILGGNMEVEQERKWAREDTTYPKGKIKRKLLIAWAFLRGVGMSICMLFMPQVFPYAATWAVLFAVVSWGIWYSPKPIVTASPSLFHRVYAIHGRAIDYFDEDGRLQTVLADLPPKTKDYSATTPWDRAVPGTFVYGDNPSELTILKIH